MLKEARNQIEHARARLQFCEEVTEEAEEMSQ